MSSNSTLAQTISSGLRTPPQVETKMDSEWEMLNYDERVDRLRNAVAHLIDQINNLNEENYKLRQNLNEHSHDKDGKSIVTKRLGYEGGPEVPYGPLRNPSSYGLGISMPSKPAIY